MNFQQKLDAAVAKNNSLLCVGLDPVLEKIPAHMQGEDAIFQFNKQIIEATHDLVCAYKPNSAFFEAYGSEGILQLHKTCKYITEVHPEIPLILDFKRGDIGSTNEGYVKFAFEYLQADAVTLHPYLGKESLSPFLQQKDKGLFILCKTSNPGSGELQNISVNGKQLSLQVAENVANSWNDNQNCMLVVGATYPEELAAIRKIVGDMALLIPGIGAQGGDVQKTVTAGLNSQKAGIVVSSSRAIIYASSGQDYTEKAREEAQRTRDEINKYRS